MKKPLLLLVCLSLAFAGSRSAARAETDGETKWRLLAEIRELEADSLRSQVKALEKKLELKELEMGETHLANSESYFRAAPTVTADGMSLASVALAESPEAGTGENAKPAQTTKTTETSATTEPPSPTTPSTNTSRWTFNYQVLKPTTRIFFDTGGDDPGEVDYFKDGDIGLSIDFLTFSADYAIAPGVWVSGFLGGGILSAAKGGEATGNAAVLMWNAGLSLSLENLPLALEVGVMQGISASESLHGDDRNDTAFFVGMSLDKLTKKKPMVGKRTGFSPPEQ